MKKIKNFFEKLLTNKVDPPPFQLWVWLLLILVFYILGFCSRRCGASIPGSKIDFIKNEYRIILNWECNKTKRDESGLLYCTKPETYLPNNDEFNVMGLTQKANADCHEEFYKSLFNPVGRLPNGNVIVKKSGEQIVKDCYYRKYFSPFKKLPKCVRLAVFDAGVLAGPVRSIKTLQKSVGVGRDGILGEATLRMTRNRNGMPLLNDFHTNFIDFLKITKHKGKSLWYGWIIDEKTGKKFNGYRNGWLNRIKYVKKLSYNHCKKEFEQEIKELTK